VTIIRPCASSQLDAVLAFWRQNAASATATDDIDALERLCARDADALLVAEDGGRIVGTVIAAWDGWRGGIYRIVVATSHRRRGLGATLLRAALGSLEARGARRIAAVVDASDAQAMAFWRVMRREGFTPDTDPARFTRTVS